MPSSAIQLTLNRIDLNCAGPFIHGSFFFLFSRDSLQYCMIYLLVESSNVEPKTQRPNCKVIGGLWTGWIVDGVFGGLKPLTSALFKGQLY